MHKPKCSPPTRRYAQTLAKQHVHTSRRAVTECVDCPSRVETFCDDQMDLRQSGRRFGNHDDLVSVLLPLATKKDWIKYVDESYNVMTSMLEVNSTHSQRDLIDALHTLSPTPAFSKSAVLAVLGAVTEILGWKLEGGSPTKAKHKILDAKAVLFLLMCFQTTGSDLVAACHVTANLRSDR